MYDLLIRGAHVLTAGDEGVRDVAVRDGLISALTPPGEAGPAREVVDATGLHLIPGLVDDHVHFRDPRSPERETFRPGAPSRRLAA